MPDARGGVFGDRPLIRWLRSQFGREWSAATDSTVLFELELRLREQMLRLTRGAPPTRARAGVGEPVRLLRPASRAPETRLGAAEPTVPAATPGQPPEYLLPDDDAWSTSPGSLD